MQNYLQKKKQVLRQGFRQGYKSTSEGRLLNALKASESLKESEKIFDNTKPKIHFFKLRIEKIRKEFNESRHETRIMHVKSNNVEIMMGSETNEIIEELFKSCCKDIKKG